MTESTRTTRAVQSVSTTIGRAVSSTGSIGRQVQGRIYREGVFGRLPVVPTDSVALETAAKRRMSPQAWSYVDGGAGQQRTVRANCAAFDEHRIVPRMLVDVEDRDLSVELFGRRIPAPLLLAPIGVLEMAHRDAEYAVAKAARSLGLPMVISTQGSVPMEDTARTLGTSPRWYQLYWSNEDDVVDSFVRRAEAIGSDALVVTLDTHVLGWRTHDLDLGYLPFARAEGIAQYTSDPVFRRLAERRAAAPRNETSPRLTLAAVKALVSMSRHYPGRFLDNLRSPVPRAAVDTFLDVFSRSSLTWDNLAYLRERTSMPIVLKGIQNPRDAVLAVEHGVDGIVVSNHGGRQVDGAIASLDALPGVVEQVRGRIPVLFDSGVRSGADVFKAIALGADAVLIGRPWVYGLALAGEAGARAVMEHLMAELDLTMALTGVTSVGAITSDLLAYRVENQRSRPPRIRRAGQVMSEDEHAIRIAAEVQVVRDEYAEEEAEAAEAEIAQRNATLDVPLNLRIDKELDAQLKRQAAAAQIPTSALVRRLLRQAVQDPSGQVHTVEQVEAIARRVVAESSNA
ncbi:MAG: alpha-hydroxy-acid oxidizing protein [Marmoricola sp.]